MTLEQNQPILNIFLKDDSSDEDLSLEDNINPGARIWLQMKHDIFDSSRGEWVSDNDIKPIHMAAFLGHVEIFRSIFAKVSLEKIHFLLRFTFCFQIYFEISILVVWDRILDFRKISN